MGGKGIVLHAMVRLKLNAALGPNAGLEGVPNFSHFSDEIGSGYELGGRIAASQNYM